MRLANIQIRDPLVIPGDAIQTKTRGTSQRPRSERGKVAAKKRVDESPHSKGAT